MLKRPHTKAFLTSSPVTISGDSKAISSNKTQVSKSSTTHKYVKPVCGCSAKSMAAGKCNCPKPVTTAKPAHTTSKKGKLVAKY